MRLPILSLICLLLIIPGCFLFNSSQKSSENIQQTDKPSSVIDPQSTDIIQEYKKLKPTGAGAEALKKAVKEQQSDNSVEMELYRSFVKLLPMNPRLCLHFVSGYEYCCEIDESEVPNT